MKNYKYNIWLPALLFAGTLLQGCISDKISEGTRKPALVKVKFEFPTLNATWTRAEPDGIDEVYMLIFDKDGNVVRREIFKNDPDQTEEIPGGQESVSVQHEIELLSQSVYDFFFGANLDGYYTALNQVGTLAELETMQISKIVPASSQSGNTPEYPEGELNFEENMNPFPRSAFERNIWVMEDPATPGYGKISYDGNTLENTFEVFVDRISPKMNISLRKMTGTTGVGDALDQIYITDIRVLRVPNYAYMIPAPYTGTAFNTMIWYEWTADPGQPNNGREDNDYFEYNNNNGVGGAGIFEHTPSGGPTEYYTRSNRTDVVIPEYIMDGNTNEQEAIILELRGDYYAWNGTSHDEYKDTWVMLPLYTGTNSSARLVYDFKRNNEYHFLITITQMQNFQFVPEMTLIVTGWDNENDPYYNLGNTDVSLSGNWTYGNGADASDIYINAGTYAEYTFTFARSGSDDSKVNWRAALTNPLDFRLLTTGGASTGGWAETDETVKVRVSPRAASHEAHSTKLYINIDDGNGGTIKLALDPSDRYVIHQNPQ